MNQRDDLTVELATLYNEIGQSERALVILEGRRFHPWEGGEGLVSGQYVASHLMLGRGAIRHGDLHKALKHFEAARSYPLNLGEGKHLLTQEADLDFFTGLVLSGLGRRGDAEHYFRSAAQVRREPTHHVFYGALALRQLGEESAAQKALQQLESVAEQQINSQVKIDYFAHVAAKFPAFLKMTCNAGTK